jgi:hypothetical protein
MRMSRTIVMVGLILVIAACSRDRDITLTRLKNPNDGPDEFSITPGLPLQEPGSYADLPAPTPGQPNLTDQNPRADGIAALGGNAQRANQGIAPSDGGLVRHAGRYGTQAGIRSTLAAEDQAVRNAYGRRNLLRIGPRDDYTEAYKRQWLDAQRERDRLQRSGVITPTAPPSDE